MIRGKKICLRALEPSDLPILYEWENSPDNWLVSGTFAPFSQHVLKEFVESPQDIYLHRQLRLMVVENTTGKTVGAVDIFDFDPAHHRAGIGILIADTARHQGYGEEGILLAKRYLFEVLHLHQIYCNIMADNAVSLRLFQHAGFEICGRKHDWIFTGQQYVDELILQCFNS